MWILSTINLSYLQKMESKLILLEHVQIPLEKQTDLMKTLWEFKRYGECGQYVSSLFPNIAKHVDDLAFIHSMHTEGVAHGPSTLFMHTGATNLVRPSMGSWILRAWNGESKPPRLCYNFSICKGGPRNYSNAFTLHSSGHGNW